MPSKVPKSRKLLRCCGCMLLPALIFVIATVIVGQMYKKNMEGFVAEIAASEKDFKLLRSQMNVTEGRGSITGQVRNISRTQTYQVATVSFRLVDRDAHALDIV